MKDLTLTVEQEALIVQAIKERKPYLLKIEETVTEVQHGSIVVEIMIRNGSVDKMNFKEVDKSWLREKSS